MIAVSDLVLSWNVAANDTVVVSDLELEWNTANAGDQEVFVASADLELQWSTARTVILHVTSDVELEWNVDEVDQPQLNEDFILDVDKALKEKISGLHVSDERADNSVGLREVRTFFRRPTRQVTEQTFPYITLDFMRIVRASSREQRGGPKRLPYTPKGYTAPDGDSLNLKTADIPIPLDFIYQVTSFSRSYSHDIQIMEQMYADDLLPPRFGWLPVGPTWRYLDVLDGPTQADFVGGPGNKRIFRKIWTVSVSGELFQTDILAISKVLKISIDVGLIQAVSADTEVEWNVAS
jgi:hypothetical protein